MVSKTFVDEDGYMVTKKEMQSCSDSDHEPEPGEQETAKSAPQMDAINGKGAASSNGKMPSKGKVVTASAQNKQSSIMSFFQKK